MNQPQNKPVFLKPDDPSINTDIAAVPDFKDILHYRIAMGREGSAKIFSVQWTINNFCNFACSYCRPGTHIEKKDFLEKEQYLFIVDRIFFFAREAGLTNVSLYLLGGETTYNPFILDILTRIASYAGRFRVMIHLTTNLSRPLSFWTQIMELFEEPLKEYNLSFKLLASFHGEYIPDAAAEALFKRKVLHVQENSKIRTTVSFVCNAETFERYDRVCRDYTDSGILTRMARDNRFASGFDITNAQRKRIVENTLEQSRKPSPAERGEPPKPEFLFRSTPEIAPHFRVRKHELEILDKNGRMHYLKRSHSLTTQNRNFFDGMLCEAGMTAFRLRPNGDIMLATAPCGKTKVGNIFDVGFKLADRPVLCTWHIQCGCKSAVSIYKYRPESFLNVTGTGLNGKEPAQWEFIPGKTPSKSIPSPSKYAEAVADQDEEMIDYE